MRVEEKEFLQLLDELLELEPGAVRRDSRMEDIDWNSLAAIGFIALVDEHFGIGVSPNALTKCGTVRDLIGLLGDRVLTTA
jgi:acyl carrier protein